MRGIIGIGADIAECLRIARMIQQHGELFINRVYTAAEVRYCQSRRESTQHFAARSGGQGSRAQSLGNRHASRRGADSTSRFATRPAAGRQLRCAARSKNLSNGLAWARCS